MFQEIALLDCHKLRRLMGEPFQCTVITLFYFICVISTHSGEQAESLNMTEFVEKISPAQTQYSINIRESG